MAKKEKISVPEYTGELKNIIKEQGDYNNILKESISSLVKMDLFNAKIAARIGSFNKDTINVKEVNAQVLKLRQQTLIETNKLKITEETSNKSTAKILKNIQASVVAQEARALASGKDFNVHEAITKSLIKKGNIEAIGLYTQQKKVELAEIALETGEKELKNEKKLSASIGITGKAFQFLSDKLKIGSKYSEEITKRTRETGKSIGFFGKLNILGKAAGSGLAEAFKDPLSSIPLIIAGFKKVLDFVLSVQDTTVKFGRSLGISTQQAEKLRTYFAAVSNDSNSVFINSAKLMESQLELTSILGTNNILSKEILSTNIQLKDIAGLEAETRSGIIQSSIISKQSVEDTTKSVLAQVVGLEQATGIAFNYQNILKEASGFGGYLGLSFAKYPGQLTKSLVSVKAMGLELKELDSMAGSFLEFETSISKEFEAQLLTGKNINLTKAREAFLNNDLAAAAIEISSQVGNSEDFLNLNRIQAESLAEAFGMSRDTLGEMLKKQELLSLIGAKNTDSAKEQLALGIQTFKGEKELSAAIGESAYNTLVKASAQEKLTAAFEKVKVALADFVSSSPLIPLVERAIDWISKKENIQTIVSWIQGAFATLFDIVGAVVGSIMKVGNVFGAGIDKNLIKSMMNGGDSIRAMNTKGIAGSMVGEQAMKTESGSTQPNLAQDRIPAPIVYVNNVVNGVATTSNSIKTLVEQGGNNDTKTGWA